MEQQKKKHRKLNYIDIILLILIIAVIGSLVYVFVSPYTERLFTTTYEIEYTVALKGVRREFKDKVREGDSLVETESLEEIGTVTKVVYTAAKYVGTDSEGHSVTSDYPGLYDVTITVSATASMPSGVYSVNEYSIMAGKSIPFRVPDFTGEGVCVCVGEVSE